MSNQQRYTYGNAIRTGSTRFFGFLPTGSLIALAVLFTFSFLFVVFGAVLFGLSTLLLGGFILFFVGIPMGDTDLTIWQQIQRRVRHGRHVASGEALFINSHLSNHSKEELLSLPGFMHTLYPVQGRDGLAQPVQLLHHDAVNMATVTFSCSPVGASMLPQRAVDAQVSAFAGWIGSLASENGLKGASITVDSTLSSSVSLGEAVLESIDPDAPAVSRKILEESVYALPAYVSKVSTYVTLGWDEKELGGGDLETAYAEISSRLHSHSQNLRAAGAGSVHVATDAEYGDILYTAYNPYRSTEIEQEIRDGVDVIRPLRSSGPEFMDARHKRILLHDGVASMTAMMTVPDPSKITEKSYERLFAPSNKFLRKRVTIFYRPEPINSQRHRIDSASRATTSENSSRRRITAFEAKKQTIVASAEAQMSSGAVLGEWCLMVTVTFEPTKAAARAAQNELKGIMGGMRWAFCDYAADAAFHQTLPVGLFPWVYSSRPQLLKPARERREFNPDAQVVGYSPLD